MTFIHEIVSEIRAPVQRVVTDGEQTAPTNAELGDDELERIVDRVVEAVLQRLAERWQE